MGSAATALAAQDNWTSQVASSTIQAWLGGRENIPLISPSPEQIRRRRNGRTDGIVECRPVDCLVRRDTGEQLREFWLAQGRDLADIGAGRATLEGRGQRHDIAFGLQRAQLQILGVLGVGPGLDRLAARSEEHTSELQSLIRLSY